MQSLFENIIMSHCFDRSYKQQVYIILDNFNRSFAHILTNLLPIYIQIGMSNLIRTKNSRVKIVIAVVSIAIVIVVIVAPTVVFVQKKKKQDPSPDNHMIAFL